MQTTINCMKLEALGNTIIGNGLPVIGSKCRQYVIRNMNNRLPTKSPRSDFDLITPRNTTRVGQSIPARLAKNIMLPMHAHTCGFLVKVIYLCCQCMRMHVDSMLAGLAGWYVRG